MNNTTSAKNVTDSNDTETQSNIEMMENLLDEIESMTDDFSTLVEQMDTTNQHSGKTQYQRVAELLEEALGYCISVSTKVEFVIIPSINDNTDSWVNKAESRLDIERVLASLTEAQKRLEKVKEIRKQMNHRPESDSDKTPNITATTEQLESDVTDIIDDLVALRGKNGVMLMD